MQLLNFLRQGERSEESPSLTSTITSKSPIRDDNVVAPSKRRKVSFLRRLCEELTLSPFFTVEDVTRRIVDIRATFAPKPRWIALCTKFLCSGVALEVFVYDLASYEHREHYFIYISHWAHALLLLYWFVVTTLSGIPELASQPKAESPSLLTAPNVLVRFAWGLFATVGTIQMAVTLVYWSWDFDYTNPVFPGYVSLMKHGGLMILVLLDGLVVNRMHVRVPHMIFPIMFTVVYCTWSILHSHLDIGNSYSNDDDAMTEDDDAIYRSINWKTDPEVAVSVAVVFTTGVVPFLFLVLWILSLWTPISCAVDGSNRRYLLEDADIALIDLAEMESNYVHI